jgi:hypothetical protein
MVLFPANAGPAVVVRAAWLSLLLFIAGCATTQQHYSLDTDEVRQWYSQARQLVQDHRGVDLQNVSLSTVTSREMLFVLSDLYGKKLDPTMTADLRVRVFADRAFAEVGFLQAVYDPFAKRIVVNEENLSAHIARMTKGGVGAREAALTVLIHELVHAADDVEFDFIDVEKRHAGDALGVYMMAEGHAELQTEDLCAKAGCSSAFELARTDYLAPNLQRNSAEEIHAVRSSNMLLLYGQSQSFLKELELRDSSGELIRQAMLSPPGSALDFFDSAAFPSTDRSGSRENIYRILNAVELEEDAKPMLKVPASPYDDSVIPLDRQQRVAFVREQRELVTGAGKMVFINQYDRDASGLSVYLFEASSADAVQIKWREFESSHHDFLRELKKYGVRAKHISEDSSTGEVKLPARVQINAAEIENSSTGKPVRLYNSLFIDGNYLIAVSNTDNLELNKKAMLEVIGQLRQVRQENPLR